MKRLLTVRQLILHTALMAIVGLIGLSSFSFASSISSGNEKIILGVELVPVSESTSLNFVSVSSSLADIVVTPGVVTDLRPGQTDTSSTKVEKKAPGKPFLDQNYPNPFNPATMIRYGLPAGTNVRLTIHTIIGNPIEVLFDEWQDAGVYEYNFAIDDLPPGIYFYRLETQFGSLTRRMTVSK